MNNVRYFKTICEITGFCEFANVPYELHELYDGYKVTFPWFDGDVICHGFSCGGRDSLLETMGFKKDDGDVRGNLLPIEVCEDIMEEYSAFVMRKWFSQGE